jgi:hypothetical protein
MQMPLNSYLHHLFVGKRTHKPFVFKTIQLSTGRQQGSLHTTATNVFSGVGCSTVSSLNELLACVVKVCFKVCFEKEFASATVYRSIEFGGKCYKHFIAVIYTLA